MPQPQFIIYVLALKMSADIYLVYDAGLCSVWGGTGLPLEIKALCI
jgi:hypothetical protein